MKQVILMRTDLNMRKGKMIAQGAHASLAFLFDQDISGPNLENWGRDAFYLSYLQKDWMQKGMKKVCLQVGSEQELLDLVEKARKIDLPVRVVTDSGHTEFDGPTITCACIGPYYDENINQITGHLKLL